MSIVTHIYKQSHFPVSKIFLVALLSLFFSACLTSITYASTMSKERTFSVNGVVQGATLTRQYYVYTNWNRGSSFSVTRCNRSNGGNCKTSKTFNVGKPSSMYHVWGTNYAQATLKKASGMVCIDLSTMEKTNDSNCGSILSSSGLSKSGDISDYRQGWTKYGNYYLRGYGIYSYQCDIWLFNSNKSIIKTYNIPVSGEVEDVMVDGDTGIVWVAMYQSAGTVTYYKVDESVFSQWIKPGAAGDGGVGYVDPTSDPDDYYDEDKTEIRDETRKHDPAVSTYDGSMDTNFFGTIQEDNKGCGVYTVLNTIIDILTTGIVIAAVIGVTISGLTYINAKDDMQKTTKAKRRIYEIVIGLVVYAVIYVALGFLLPGGKFNENKSCSQVSIPKNSIIGELPPTILS